MVFIGHVDAGKSTIAGTVMFLTGNVDQRVIEKYEREAKERGRDSWYMAYIMDTNDEERAKGKTVEVGMAHFTTETKRFTVLDAPGHANYVPNMIGGAAQADIGVLVVSARKNEFEQGFDRGGQTREHAMLALTLGVSKLIVLVNKMDTCDWSQDRFKQIRKNLGPFLRRIGYKVKRDVSWVCCSGLNGENIKERVAEDVAPWMPEKRSFLEVVDSLDMTKGRKSDGPLRIPILDKYSNRGTWIMGKIEQGTVRDGDTIGLLPNRERVLVEEIQVADEPVAFASTGESVAIKLKNVSVSNVQRGFVLTSLTEPMPCVNTFSAQIMILDLLPQKSIMTAGYSCILHTHTAIEECTVSKLLANVGKNGKPVKGERPGFAKSNQAVIARIKLNRKVCVHTYEQMSQLGRFTLRDEGKTIAIGKILRLGK
jgi:peptide chain release factor subunit 3